MIKIRKHATNLINNKSADDVRRLFDYLNTAMQDLLAVLSIWCNNIQKQYDKINDLYVKNNLENIIKKIQADDEFTAVLTPKEQELIDQYQNRA